jgi:hypothetical protein
MSGSRTLDLPTAQAMRDEFIQAYRGMPRGARGRTAFGVGLQKITTRMLRIEAAHLAEMPIGARESALRRATDEASRQLSIARLGKEDF